MEFLRECLRAVLFMTPWVLLIALALMLTRRFLHKKISPRFFQLAWLLVALRLALPFDLSLPGAPVVVPVPAAVQSAAPAEAAAAQLHTAPLTPQTESAVFPAVPHAGSQMHPVLRFLSGTALPAVWGIGAAAFFLAHLAAYLLFIRRLKQTRIPSPEPVRRAAAEAFGRPVCVYLSPSAEGPMLAGFFRPAVYLPASGVPQKSLPYIFAHEAAHARHGDTRTQFLLLAAQSLHWFDPAVHCIARAAREDMEESCDEAALAGRSLAYRQAYGTAVLEVLKSFGCRKPAPVFSTAFSDGTSMKRRFSEMFSFEHKKRGAAALAALALLIAGVSTLVGCGHCTAKAESIVSLRAQAHAASSSHIESSAAPEKEESPVPAASSLPEAEITADSAFVLPFADDAAWSFSQPFGAEMPSSGKTALHRGIDLAADTGTPIRAVCSGVVQITPEISEEISPFTYGNYLTITNGGTAALYAHCSEILVHNGDTVQAGDIIARVGSTGNSTGAHLHLEILYNGTPVDPCRVIAQLGSAPAARSK